MITILAIDPGKTGASCILDRDSVLLEPLPMTEKGELDLRALIAYLTHYAQDITMAYLEIPGTRPGESPHHSGQSFRSFGRIEGVLAALCIPMTAIYPQQWSKDFPHGVTEKDVKKRYKLIKIVRREIAAKLYPGIDMRATEGSTLPADGMVDAILIARWGMQQQKEARHERD